MATTQTSLLRGHQLPFVMLAAMLIIARVEGGRLALKRSVDWSGAASTSGYEGDEGDECEIVHDSTRFAMGGSAVIYGARSRCGPPPPARSPWVWKAPLSKKELAVEFAEDELSDQELNEEAAFAREQYDTEAVVLEALEARAGSGDSHLALEASPGCRIPAPPGLLFNRYDGTLDTLAEKNRFRAGGDMDTCRDGIAVSLRHALDFMHAAGYVHMDVKADNVFYNSVWDGETELCPEVWLGDFGLAQRIGEAVPSGTCSPHHSRALCEKGATAAVDMDAYALGYLLHYQLFLVPSELDPYLNRAREDMALARAARKQ